MLKIKDGVDLKELEKYGFKRVIDPKGNPMERWWTDKEPGKYIIVTNDDIAYNRKLSSADWEANKNLETLYDLIKADLVEKVE